MVDDLMDQNLQYKSKERLEAEYSTSLNFIDYATLTMSIAQRMFHPATENESVDLPWCQEYIRTILCDTKNHRTIKTIFNLENTTQPTSKRAWQNEVQIQEADENWKHFLQKPSHCIRDISLRMFQYKILHRILPTNRKLKQYGRKESDLCDFCGRDFESILHLFCECDISTMIWQELVDWLYTHGLGLTYLTDSQILFGDRSRDPIVNRIVIVVKFIIFKNKQRNKVPTPNQVIFILKKQFEIKHHIARTHNRL